MTYFLPWLAVPSSSYQSIRLAYSHQLAVLTFLKKSVTNQQYFSLRTNQYQPPARRTDRSRLYVHHRKTDMLLTSLSKFNIFLGKLHPHWCNLAHLSSQLDIHTKKISNSSILKSNATRIVSICLVITKLLTSIVKRTYVRHAHV
jgi:hypothetical protein